MRRQTSINKVFTKELLQQEYDQLQSFRKIGEKYNISRETARWYCAKYDIKINKLVRYECDHDFFSRDNEESFYIAGFIAADGCVKKHSTGNSYQLQIGLAKTDKEFLEMLRQTMQAEAPIKDFLVKNSKRNPNWNDCWKSELTITSKKMYDDLARFNIIPRKSLIYTFPEWMKTHPLKHHFIRGYNDGDGSFYVPKLKEGRTVPQIYFTMRGTPKFLTDVRYILEQECSIEKRDTPIRISSGHGCLEYGGNGIISKIIGYLYKDANIYLNRKKF